MGRRATLTDQNYQDLIAGREVVLFADHDPGSSDAKVTLILADIGYGRMVELLLNTAHASRAATAFVSSAWIEWGSEEADALDPNGHRTLRYDPGFWLPVTERVTEMIEGGYGEEEAVRTAVRLRLDEIPPKA